MRLSWPMPRRTSLMSALIRSQRFAISLMKLILVESSALATYLVSSALSGDMTRNGFSVRRNGLYSSCSAVADFLAAHADDDAVGLHEVVDRRAFFEELGVAGHVAIAARAFFEPREDLCARADGHRALGDDDRIRLQVRRDAVDDRPERRHIGGAVVALRRADGEINDFGRGDRGRARSVVNCSRSAAWLSRTISSRPGS